LNKHFPTCWVDDWSCGSDLSAPRSAYVHVPFCRHRCGYCNFTVVAGRDDLIEEYLRALAIELGWLGGPQQVDTLFVGGGTPTQLDPTQLRRLLQLVTGAFPLAASGEFSVEANPSDVTAECVSILAAAGVTRLSLGAQSWDELKLRALERDHRSETIERAARLARPSIRSLGIDLIFAAPGETRGMWQHDLQHTIALAPDHVSTYGLTYERGAAFWSRRASQQILPVSEADEQWMYEAAIDQLQAAGWEHYEVSNFARPGHRCRHNELCWMGQEYFAAGPGASRYVGGSRETNHRSTTTYLRRVLQGRSPVAESERLSDEDRARERLVFGLRRMEGIQLSRFRQETGFDAARLAAPALTRFCQLGLLSLGEDCLQLTRRGLMVSDGIWVEFLRR
jgi:oxygen-independent coproporphyrinogen-3 oxidase